MKDPQLPDIDKRLDSLVSSLTDGSVTRLKKKYQFNHSGRQALELMADDIKPRAKQAIKSEIHRHYISKQEVLEAIEKARIDGMFIEWNGLNLMDIDQIKSSLRLEVKDNE